MVMIKGIKFFLIVFTMISNSALRADINVEKMMTELNSSNSLIIGNNDLIIGTNVSHKSDFSGLLMSYFKKQGLFVHMNVSVVDTSVLVSNRALVIAGLALLTMHYFEARIKGMIQYYRRGGLPQDN
jgi:hypothetical protein